MTDSSPPKPRPRWYHLRRRTLVVLVLLCALMGSIYAVMRQAGRKQREAVAAIRKAGGSVAYEPKGTERGVSSSVISAWLTGLLGKDTLWDVVTVSLANEESVDDDFLGEHVKGLDGLVRRQLVQVRPEKRRSTRHIGLGSGRSLPGHRARALAPSGSKTTHAWAAVHQGATAKNRPYADRM